MGNLLDLFLSKYNRTDFHELNLDWLITEVTEMINQVENFVSINAVKYANPIQWDITRQYEKNTIVIDPVTGTAYISVAPVPAGVALTRSEYWTVVFDLQSFVTKANQNLANHYESQTTTTATMNTAAGEWVIWGDVLYKALVNITTGDAYVVGSNIQRVVIEDVINAIMQALADEIQARQDADDAINVTIGDLEDLATGDKSSVVNAINDEVQARQDADTALQELILSASSYYDTIADFKEDANIAAGKNCVVNGYYAPGDCSSMIWNTTSTAMGVFGEIQLDNELYAHLLKIDEKYFDVRQYGAYGDGVHDDFDILNDVINAAVADGNATVYLPEGKYKIRTYLSSLRTATTDGQTIKDLNNLTLCGSGDLSMLYGENPTSIFDILQLNQVKNITIKNLKLYEIGTPTAHGANGVSITNGGVNITLENITVESLPYYVGTGYVDGGKGFTLQWEGTPAYPFKDIIIRNCRVNNSPIGFELDVYNTSEVVNNIIVESCKFNVSYCGFIMSSATASNNASVIFTDSVINTTQRGIWIARGKNIIANNITVMQTEAITTIIPDDARVAGLELYADTEGCYFNNITFRYSNGSYCILFKGTGAQKTSGATFSNLIALGTYTNAMFAVDGVAPELLFLLNNLNYGAPTTYMPDLLEVAQRNDVFGYSSYNVFNRMIMTNAVDIHTLGTYNGTAIAVYNTLGQLQGYVPLYS